MRTSLAVLFVLAVAVAVAGVASAAVTPLSDTSLSAVAAGHHGGSDDGYKVALYITDKGQEYTSALNLINAVGPVQAGNNILVMTSAFDDVTIGDSNISQRVMNVNSAECAPCSFDEASWEIGVCDKGQKHASALNLINAGGLVQAGNNLVVMYADDDAKICGSTIAQTVINYSTQSGGGQPE